MAVIPLFITVKRQIVSILDNRSLRFTTEYTHNRGGRYSAEAYPYKDPLIGPPAACHPTFPTIKFAFWASEKGVRQSQLLE